MNDVKFLFATQPLAVLSRIATEDECEALENEYRGLIKPELLRAVLHWMHVDR